MLYDPKWQEKIETPVLNEPWRESLREAAAVIQKRGWVQGRLSDDKGRVCTVGAFCLLRNYIEGYVRFSDYISVRYMKSIANWNDVPGRTKEEVVEALLYVANT